MVQHNLLPRFPLGIILLRGLVGNMARSVLHECVQVFQFPSRRQGKVVYTSEMPRHIAL